MTNFSTESEYKIQKFNGKPQVYDCDCDIAIR